MGTPTCMVRKIMHQICFVLLCGFNNVWERLKILYNCIYNSAIVKGFLDSYILLQLIDLQHYVFSTVVQLSYSRGDYDSGMKQRKWPARSLALPRLALVTFSEYLSLL